MSSIATRTGDDGTTGLLHGARVPKTDPRIEAIGAIDELSALLGCALSALPPDDAESPAVLAGWREDLVSLMAEIAVPPGGRPPEPGRGALAPERLARLDGQVAALEKGGVAFRDWNAVALPGAHALLELARTVCRRAERRVWALEEPFLAARPLVPRYLNRLADVLWLWARKDSA